MISIPDLTLRLQNSTDPLAQLRDALAPLGRAAVVADSVDALVDHVVRDARAGDHVVCMSNGGFGGIHDKLLAALATRGR